VKNNCVLITGASSGFGEACARRYAEAGARLILVARNLSKLQTIQSEHSKHKIQVIALDLCDANAIDALIDQLEPEFKSIDILINNAGLALGLDPAWEADIDEWDTMLDTNCRGLMRMTRRILPGMVERNHGHIVNIGSTAGNWPYAGGNVYGATKAFVQQFSRNLRSDLLGKSIRVSNIEPGMSETNFSNVRFNGDNARAESVYDNVQALSPEDIAETIFWTTSLPAHININTMELMPTCQAWSPLSVNREMKQ
jgi:3-hydroxy acid dehydrogenase/malonic semialdehyde reductase